MLAARHRRFLEAYIDMNLQESMSKEKAQKIRLKISPYDSDVYTDHKIIHLGLLRLRDSDDFLADALYFLGHEIQHLHSTNQKAWLAGQSLGLQEIYRYITKQMYGHEIVPKRASDLKAIPNRLRKDGLYISSDSINQTVHFIMNSLEDGRIEAIRQCRHKGFLLYTRHYRSKLWEQAVVEPYDNDTLTASEELRVVLNQIFSLATCSVWQKGFTSSFVESDQGRNKAVYARCTELIPYIAAAVTAPSCRACMEEGRKICQKLADLIFEAAKETSLDDLLRNLIKEALEAAARTGDYSFGNGQQSGDGTAESLFGSSVLVLKVDDDTFDKLENGKETSSGQPNVIIVREHPKEQPSENNALSEASASENGSDGDFDGQKQSENSIGDSTQPQKTSQKDPSGGSGKPSEKEIANKVQDIKEKVKEKLNSVHSAAERTAKEYDNFKAPYSTNPNPTPPLPVSEIKEMYKEEGDVNYREIERTYQPSDMLPFSLKKRGDALKKQLQKKLQMKKTPRRRAQRAGSLDSSRVASLAMGDFSVFKKREKGIKPDVAAYILMDNSGSMDGNKFVNVCEATAVIEEGFKDFCPLKITAFSANNSLEVLSKIVKDWDEKGKATLSYNFLTHERTEIGNKDGFSIRAAAADLSNRPEKNKLLLVLSDGLPSEYKSMDCGMDDTRDAIQTARAAGITVIGIYFSDEDSSSGFDEQDNEVFRSMYGEASVCTTSDKVEDELVLIMSKFFFA